MNRGAAVILLLIVSAVSLTAQRYSAAGKVVNSRHDLSVNSAGGTYKAALPNADPQNQVCVFCHTPHKANPAAPLWNHAVSGFTYTPLYTSSTLVAAVAQPTPTDNTRLCLSCHDGTVALGNTVNNGNITMANSVTTLPAAAGTAYSPPRNTNLGTRLADDHPVAFTPSFPVLPAYPQVQTPPAGDAVALETGKMQCTTCHNPHEEAIDATERRFLRKVNSGAAICTTCHKWQGSSGGANSWNWISGPSSDHQSHINPYNAATNDPGDSDSPYLGAHTSYTTTATNACEACHRPHTAHVTQRLLKGGGNTAQGSAQVCFQCHDGNLTTNIKNPPTNGVVQNIKTAFTGATYKHPGSTVAGSSGATDAGHDPGEILPISSRHAACDDCHSPHAAKGYESAGGVFPVPPNMPSTLWGVRGVKADGTVRNRTAGNDDALYEYEICFKCHADSNNKPQTTNYTDTGIGYGRMPKRYWDFSGATNCNNALTTRGNTRNQFSVNTTSFHPVVKALNHTATYQNNATAVPSLRPYIKAANGTDITSRPLTASSIVYCTDCHNSDSGRDTVSTRLGNPAGPHGSANAHIGERANLTDTPRDGSGTGTCSTGTPTVNAMTWSLANYALCDKCHDVTYLTSGTDTSFGGYHRDMHVTGGDGQTACDTCHDPHASQSPALINFDKAIVGPSNGVISYTQTSLHHGSCTLTCHGKQHNPLTY